MTAGRYSVYPGDEEPTKPGVPGKDSASILQALCRNLTPEERRELVLLADAWFRCSANGRALVRGLACELALPQ